MSSGEDPCPEHTQRTRRRNLRYCFYNKHRGRGPADAARWAPEVTEAEEFAIFDEADDLDFSDENGNLYGMRRSPDGEILDLGTRGEQVAKFWEADANQPWHGFPLWPASGVAPNRRKISAPSQALAKMEGAGLLTSAQKERLRKGKQL